MRFTLVIAFGLLASPALAIDFSAPILDAIGKPVQVCDDPRDKATCGPATLGKFASGALLAELQT